MLRLSKHVCAAGHWAASALAKVDPSACRELRLPLLRPSALWTCFACGPQTTVQALGQGHPTIILSHCRLICHCFSSGAVIPTNFCQAGLVSRCRMQNCRSHELSDRAHVARAYSPPHTHPPTHSSLRCSPSEGLQAAAGRLDMWLSADLA